MFRSADNIRPLAVNRRRDEGVVNARRGADASIHRAGDNVPVLPPATAQLQKALSAISEVDGRAGSAPGLRMLEKLGVGPGSGGVGACFAASGCFRPIADGRITMTRHFA